MDKKEYAEELADLLESKVKLINYHCSRIMQDFANKSIKLNHKYLEDMKGDN